MAKFIQKNPHYLRKHQQRALQAIDDYFYDTKENEHTRALVEMFCGTGKTRVFTSWFAHSSSKVNVIVFPSLALIRQYRERMVLTLNTLYSLKNLIKQDCHPQTSNYLLICLI